MEYLTLRVTVAQIVGTFLNKMLKRRGKSCKSRGIAERVKCEVWLKERLSDPYTHLWWLDWPLSVAWLDTMQFRQSSGYSS